jgi:hypothetical protein
MHTIARSFFLETSIHTLTAEVSELFHGKQLEGHKGLPKRFVIPNMGNGNPFIATRIVRSESDDLQSVEYHQLLGCLKAIIFND